MQNANLNSGNSASSVNIHGRRAANLEIRIEIPVNVAIVFVCVTGATEIERDRANSFLAEDEALLKECVSLLHLRWQ
jgi:hypothetical protein